MKFKPLRDRVLVKFSTEEEKTAGGLFIPDSRKSPRKALSLQSDPVRLPMTASVRPWM